MNPRVKVLRVAPELFVLFAKASKNKGYFLKIKNSEVPNDAKIIEVTYDNLRQSWVIVLESKEFPEIELGQPLEEVIVELEAVEIEENTCS